MPSSLTLSPKIIAILIIPVILLLSLVAVSFLFKAPIPNSMDLKLDVYKGGTLETTSLRGHVLVVEFMATWCDYCKEIGNNIAQMLSKNAFNNVVFLSVSIDPSYDTDNSFQNFISANNFTSYVNNGWFFTRDMTQQYTDYGVGSVPTTFLVNNASTILSTHNGYFDYNFLFNWLSSPNVALQSNITSI